jgi:hypothetical protein
MTILIFHINHPVSQGIVIMHSSTRYPQKPQDSNALTEISSNISRYHNLMETIQQGAQNRPLRQRAETRKGGGGYRSDAL